MNKEKCKGVIIGIIIASILFVIPNSTLANDIKSSIMVAFNKINIVVNGVEVEGDNILYDGTTYVPLRAISEMLGKYVSWDSKTNTAVISDEELLELEKIDPIVSIDFSELHNEKGNFETNGLHGSFIDKKVKVRNEDFSIENGILFSSIYPSQTSYVLDEQFTKLTGYFAVNDDNQHYTGRPKYDTSFIEILGDNEVIFTKRVYRGEKPSYFEVDITNVDALTFYGGKILGWDEVLGDKNDYGGVLIDLKLWN